MALSKITYSEATYGYDQFGLILCGLIREVLIDAGIQILSVTHRVKSEESALRKLSLGRGKYSSILDLTDLLGVRVITYFPDDVDKVAEVFVKEFAVDESNSVDKRKLLDPDRFGYLSLHYVATLSSNRADLTEYKRFSHIKFELQIRSVLQHAWAEIEHDLGYKAEAGIPIEVRRNFSRLAGLLELADEGFEKLRHELSSYEKRVSETIKQAPQRLPIDQSTIVEALKSEPMLIELDEKLAATAKYELKPLVEASYAGSEARELKFLGVKDISQLLSLLEIYKDHIILFVKFWIEDRDTAYHSTTPFPRGICLFYLGYILAAQTDDSKLILWGQQISGRKTTLLTEVRATWSKVTRELGKPAKSPKSTITS